MLAVDFFLSGGPLRNAVAGEARFFGASFEVFADQAVHQDVAIVLIGDERFESWLVVNGVGALTLADVPVVVGKEADFARVVGIVGEAKAAHEDVAVEVHGVGAGEA